MPLARETDVVLLLDGSRGVSRENLRHQKQFIKLLANHFGLNPYGPRGSAVIYGQRPLTLATFTSSDFNQRVDRASVLRTPRRMDRALEQASRMLSQRGRRGRKIVVLLTAGSQSRDAPSLDEAIKPLKQLGAQVFVVGIGQQIGTRQIRLAVDRPQDIFKVLSHTNLPSKSQPIAVKIRSKTGICLTYLFLI